MITTVFCVACESTGSGLVNWHMSAAAAEQQYREFVADAALATDTVTRFDFLVDDLIEPSRLAKEVDDAMWGVSYVPLKRRVGTDSIHGMVTTPDTGVSPRFQTSHWAQITAEGRTLDADFKAHLVQVALPHQAAFSRLMEAYNGEPVGIECRHESREVWAFTSPSVITPTSKQEWRVQTFDVNGFIGHECYNTMIEAVEAMTRDYPQADPGALDRCATTKKWAIGLETQKLRDQFSRGEFSYAELVKRVQEVGHTQDTKEEVAA